MINYEASTPIKHEHDPKRIDQTNRWFGADTCECICGCTFIAIDGMCSTCKLKAKPSKD